MVLIAGDISWAMHFEDAVLDLKAVCDLPGKKVMIKGNHDFWHNSLAKTRALLGERAYFLQNDALQIGEFVFAGTRGWKQRTDADFTAADERIYAREVERLKLSLMHVRGGRLIGMMHYPPFLAGRTESAFTRLFAQHGAEAVVYGHVHGKALRTGDYTDVVIGGAVTYMLTSCDYLDFKLRLIAQS